MDNYLLPSLIRWELPYYVNEVKDLGNWRRNANYKLLFIKNCLDEFKTNLVFIDADAIINKFPSLFWRIPSSYDIAYHYMDDSLYIPNGYRKTLLTGTLFLRYNDRVMKFMDKWIELTGEKNNHQQETLKQALKDFPEIKVYKLPRSYCYLATVKGGKMTPIVPEKNPAISHYQASRKMRGKK